MADQPADWAADHSPEASNRAGPRTNTVVLPSHSRESRSNREQDVNLRTGISSQESTPESTWRLTLRATMVWSGGHGPQNAPRCRSSSLVLLPSTRALAWSNGVHGPNTFGTHDLILREALRISHQRANWVCVRVAMRATDDPDMLNGIDHASGTWWHVWDEWGATYGGAPEAVRVWYHRVERKLANGHRCAASKALGIMSHMLGDVAQPMHTDGRLAAEDRVHAAYEHDVDERCSPSQCQFAVVNDGVDRVQPYAATVGAGPRRPSLVRETDPSVRRPRLHRSGPRDERATDQSSVERPRRSDPTAGRKVERSC